jgi:hypothetical protein
MCVGLGKEGTRDLCASHFVLRVHGQLPRTRREVLAAAQQRRNIASIRILLTLALRHHCFSLRRRHPLEIVDRVESVQILGSQCSSLFTL